MFGLGKTKKTDKQAQTDANNNVANFISKGSV